MTAASEPVPAPLAAGEGRGHFFGGKWEYRRILWGAMPALIVTLGLHRFNVTTNIRRYLWSRTVLAGEQLDYTGEPIELLLGFLVLIVLLAPVFVGLAIWGWSVGEYLPLLQHAPLLLLLPLAILALYQARRYRLNHTVFRGLCFRQTGSAWVFVLRVALWTGVVAVTLGLAYPWARADLERYKMRHTWYGDLQGSFVGSAWELFKRGFVPWFAAIVLSLGALAALGNAVEGDGADEAAGLAVLFFLWLLLMLMIFYPIFRAIVVRWRIAGMRFGDLSFESDFSKWRFCKPYLKFYGWMLVLVIGTTFLSMIVDAVVVSRFPVGESLLLEILGVVCMVIFYFTIATIITFAFQGTVRFETWRLIIDSLVIRGLDQLDRVRAPAEGVVRRRGRIAAALNLGGF